jgi:hypothetical protein
MVILKEYEENIKKDKLDINNIQLFESTILRLEKNQSKILIEIDSFNLLFP